MKNNEGLFSSMDWKLAVQLVDEVILILQEIWPAVVNSFKSLSPDYQDIFQGLEDEEVLSDVILAVIALELARARVLGGEKLAAKLTRCVVERVSELNPEFSESLSRYLLALGEDKPLPVHGFDPNSFQSHSELCVQPSYRYGVRTDALAATVVSRWSIEDKVVYLMMRNWFASIPSIVGYMIEAE